MTAINFSFRQKILLLLIACMCLAQMMTMVATLMTTERAVRQSVTDDLGVAEGIFDRLFEQRFYQLSESVRIMADDTVFRVAITSGDVETVKSALEDHAARADASIAIFLDPLGRVLASTLETDDWQLEPLWSDLVFRVRKNENLFTTYTIQDLYYQIVSVPVTGPDNSGWLLMGFAIDDGMAEEFKSLSGLHISIYDGHTHDYNEVVSTLDFREELQLIEALSESPLQEMSENQTAELKLLQNTYLTRIKPLDSSSSRLFAILQKSLAKELTPYRELKHRLITLFLAALIIAIAIGIFTGGNIIAPIQRLANAARRIGEGNYSIDVEVDSNDEIGQLGLALNGMQHEIADREYRIVHQVHHDDLTGLPNRYLVQDRIHGAINRARRSKIPFTLVMLDIVRFKQINDSLGHDVGDMVLQETAHRLAGRLRKTDTAARLGGDDFLLVLENTDLQTAIGLIEENISKKIMAPVKLDEMQVSLDFCFGLVEFPSHGDTAAALLRRCEIALYDAKEKHGFISVYEIGRDESHIRQLGIVSDLNDALWMGQLTLHYQPKVNLQTGEINQAEALIRWIHPKFGFLPPDEFIAVLERTGNIYKLTRWVIKQAARQCRTWQDYGLELSISINISTLDLLNTQLPLDLGRATSRYGLNPGRIVLEITESAVMHDPVLANEILGRLRKDGYRIGIDDFGTGYSSLAQLKSLPVCELKIDKSFVMKLEPDTDDALIVKSTIDLAHSMGLEVIAEGVETVDGALQLRAMGCETAQGYLFSKPLPAIEFEQWCLNNRQRYSLLDDEAA